MRLVLFLLILFLIINPWWRSSSPWWRSSPPFIYRTDICDTRDIQHLIAPLLRTRLRAPSQPTDVHVGQGGRKSITLTPAASNKELYDRLDTLLPGYHVRRDVPVEYRLYYTGSTGMNWHRDQRLSIDAEYLEGVLTLHNDSDSVFEYMQGSLVKKHIVPREGTLVLVKPEDLLHRVTPVRKGSREILKMVFSPNVLQE